MYKIWHKLFGWDYVHWSNSYARGISRVRLTPDGTAFYWRYRFIHCLDKITSADQVTWLTCKPEKYIL
jgi:hypothetical protein